MKKHPAASILYAIVITTVIIVTAGTMSASFIRASQRNHDLYRSTQAYYAARAAMEEGIAAVSDSGQMGFETSNSSAIGWDTNSSNANDVTGEFEVFSRAKGIGWRSATYAPPQPAGCTVTNNDSCYVVPIPGTGTAGDDCDVSNPPAAGWTTSINDQCNWNKIEYEETVTIPLYYEDTNCTDNICNPAELMLNNFIVRIRPPNSEQLDGGNQVIVNWEISGDCDTDGISGADETCYMVANGGVTNNSQIMASNNTNSMHSINLNTQKDVLNILFQNTTLKALSDRVPGTIINASWFMRAKWQGALPPPYRNFEILNPSLKLSVIYPLTTGTGATRIPNLEYQILTDQPISDNKIVYLAEGRAEGRQGIYVRTVRATQGLDSNAIINFVIQN